VLADDWYGPFCLDRIVHNLYKAPTKNNWVTHLKIEPIIPYFSFLGLFRIRVSTLYVVPSKMSENRSEEVKEAQKAETFKCCEMFYFVATVINYANSYNKCGHDP
jgi:hypothetical protein